MIDEHDLCWLVDRAQRRVKSAGCGVFEKHGSAMRLRQPQEDLADVYWAEDGSILGRPWDDVLADCSAYLARIFRRPDFAAHEVSFGGCERRNDVVIKLPSRTSS
jgi:hypothetical protein